jgi:hypothetical protein
MLGDWLFSGGRLRKDYFYVKDNNGRLKQPNLSKAETGFRERVAEYLDKGMINKNTLDVDNTDTTYIATDGSQDNNGTTLFKIGRTTCDVQSKQNSMQTYNLNMKIVAYGKNVSESEVHDTFATKRVHLNREFFALTDDELAQAKKMIGDTNGQ